ncbi:MULTISPECIES: Rha family transcriptional regulator [unclassified Xanthomonas]|uniref:Rha family transcriptional regulator n=1 Tax=unclassified Xanthomonas TaxID=2643310 RepID=UPI002A82A7D4|nr:MULTISPECIES: Rha family transcriptional regulator [unclassified Xanthomonas]MDY4297544.1 Rha family transcriptional regulator [Xanthomonas sp. LF02-5]MDY4359338.1 Rha family transcriptional regulator [Xanthomonas sp. LF04-12]
MTDLIPTSDNAATITSREIAELVDSRHDSVKRTIERLATAGVIASPPAVEKPTAGRPVAEYVFSGEQGKRDSIVVVAQLSPEFTARLVDRWRELEERVASAKLPAIKDPRIAALVEVLVRQDCIEQEQARQATEVARLQEDLAVVEARTQPENKHFTVMGYANLIGASVDIKAASTLGRRCAALSREKGFAIGDIRDPRFGRVHTYHETILQAVLQESA